MAFPIKELLEYDLWATERVLGSLAALSAQQFTCEPGGELSSIRQQSGHLVLVVDRYRARLMGETPPDRMPESFETPQEVIAYWEEVADRMRLLIDAISPDKLDVVIRHDTRRGVFFATYLETLLHVVNHSTYHRGQIAALLKVAGFEPLDTDLVLSIKARSEP